MYFNDCLSGTGRKNKCTQKKPTLYFGESPKGHSQCQPIVCNRMGFPNILTDSLSNRAVRFLLVLCSSSPIIELLPASVSQSKKSVVMCIGQGGGNSHPTTRLVTEHLHRWIKTLGEGIGRILHPPDRSRSLLNLCSSTLINIGAGKDELCLIG